MKKVVRMPLSDVKNGLSSVVDNIIKKGDVVIITRHGHDAARLTPIGPVKGVALVHSKPPHRFRAKHVAGGESAHVVATGNMEPPSGHRQSATTWEDLNSLAEQIRKAWPKGITAEDVMNDIRGE